MKKLQVKILDERMRSMLPHYATAGAAGLDLRACVDAPLTLNPGDSQLVPSGISIYVAYPRYAAVLLMRATVDERVLRDDLNDWIGGGGVARSS